MPIPRRLAAAGVTDMVRISDARMSGTAFGTVVLHVAPEGSLGPLGLVRDGDIIELDARSRLLNLLVDGAELERRRREVSADGGQLDGSASTRWRAVQTRLITQADRGADIDVQRLA